MHEISTHRRELSFAGCVVNSKDIFLFSCWFMFTARIHDCFNPDVDSQNQAKSLYKLAVKRARKNHINDTFSVLCLLGFGRFLIKTEDYLNALPLFFMILEYRVPAPTVCLHFMLNFYLLMIFVVSLKKPGRQFWNHLSKLETQKLQL